MTSTPRFVGLLDPEVVLRRHVEDLSARFAGMVSAETVERMVFESYAALGRTARVKTHLPVLTCRFATERLTALAQAKGALAKGAPEVLFVCVQNAGRSQMAAAMVEHLSEGRVHVRSAGSMPADQVDPVVLEVLEARGMTVTDAFPKPLTDDVVQAADVVITMGCGDACPVYPGKRYLDWNVVDPAGRPPAEVEAIAADVEGRVRELLAEFGA
ncbi:MULTISPECIES: arsenate-mycothiol transferase ArsC [unclassified Modestobacter]|uniref:arsenate-mycothiol transferase ArsC n=1 Tax=unclassified Modestobacter TaxID=2643866 RepID=UPI0022AA855B|nr:MULTISPECIES: arsenate reductase ArsC [unclassified Modestobacter]MCZ2824984.1 arsenate reductase ArsC [Modestobacter sp. VKM Ac-2981]MCZ2854513.1 arsenate reductase ArsC [Modestobacter sp. VKM Ac-2982]